MSEKKRGALIPPSYYSYPALIIGERAYLESLKKAVEEALSVGIGRVVVNVPEGTYHSLIVKLEENRENLPSCYGDFLETKDFQGKTYVMVGESFRLDEWKKGNNLAFKLEQFWINWRILNFNFSYLLLSLFKRKLNGAKTLKEKNKVKEEYSYLQKRLNSLFWDDEGLLRLATEEELKEFMDILYDTWKFPNYCFDLLCKYSTEDFIEKYIELSIVLHEKGFPNGSLKANHYNNVKESFLLFVVNKSIPDSELKKLRKLKEKNWKSRGRRLYIPLELNKGDK